MKIGNVEIKSNLVLAPMAGVTDFAFRALAKNFGAGLTYTEMVSAKGLVLSKNREVYKEMLYTLPTETPCAVQIFGSEPEIMAKACTLPELQKFDIIDINMGCPAPKVIKNGDGSALLLDTDKAVAVAKACVEATNKPITVKMRSGFWQNSPRVAILLARKLEEVGVKAITIHGRTRQDMYSGNVDLEIIKAVKQAVKIPVIGNGDVVDKESLNNMLNSGVDAVMIGRGAMGAPWIFWELNNDKKLSNQEKFEAICQHVENLKTIYPEKYLSVYLRKHFLWYVKGFKNIAPKKVELAGMKTTSSALDVIKSIYLSQENLLPKN